MNNCPCQEMYKNSTLMIHHVCQHYQGYYNLEEEKIKNPENTEELVTFRLMLGAVERTTLDGIWIKEDNPAIKIKITLKD